MDLPQSNTLIPVYSYTRTELLSLRTKTSLLSLFTVDRIKDLTFDTILLHHHMSLTCCIKSHCTPATLAPAHTPCLFSIDLHTVRQHLVIVHFLLLLLLSGTLFQMMSGVPHHCHHFCLV